MNNRKYSKKFIESEIEKIDKMNEKCQENFPMLPERLYDDEYKFLLKDILEWNKHHNQLSHINGFWQGWVLRDGLKD